MNRKREKNYTLSELVSHKKVHQQTNLTTIFLISFSWRDRVNLTGSVHCACAWGSGGSGMGRWVGGGGRRGQVAFFGERLGEAEKPLVSLERLAVPKNLSQINVSVKRSILGKYYYKIVLHCVHTWPRLCRPASLATLSAALCPPLTWTAILFRKIFSGTTLPISKRTQNTQACWLLRDDRVGGKTITRH